MLPRLADGSYDMVVVDAVKAEYAEYLVEALRLLRHGGVVAFDNALRDGKVVDPTARDAESGALRELARAVRENTRLVPVMLPVGGGLLAAVRHRRNSSGRGLLPRAYLAASDDSSTPKNARSRCVTVSPHTVDN